MGLRSALTVLAEQWEEIRGRLPAAEFAEISDLVDEFTREGDQEVSEEIVEEIADLLRARLPHDHSFLSALTDRSERLAPNPERRAEHLADWLRLSEHLRVRLGRQGPTAAEVERDIMARMRAVPALRADELIANGQDPADPALIRLTTADGTPSWPAFQFAADGSSLPIVRSINQVLEAAGDPLGAADWWLGDNGRLGDAPIRLLGRIPDGQLIAAARNEKPEV
ncbi:hypothetical protein AB0K48_34365 [Nonomuraea sp. NPDC055795]